MLKIHAVSRVLAAAVSSTFVFGAAPAQAFSVTVNGTAATSCQAPVVDTQGNITINCSTSGTASCSVNAQPNFVPASGGSVTLTSNCGAVSSWTGGKSASGGASTSWTDTIPANTSASNVSFRYTVVGANGTGFADVTQAGTGSAPPPTSGISCSNIPGISNTKVISVPWQATIGTGFSTKGVGFAPGDAVVFVINPPSGASSGGKLGSFRVSPTDASSYNTRIMSISASPCDFSRSMGIGSVVQGQEPTVYFSVGGYPLDKYGRTTTTNANLTGGRPYYVTVIQEVSVGGANACNSSYCNVNYGLTPGF